MWYYSHPFTQTRLIGSFVWWLILSLHYRNFQVFFRRQRRLNRSKGILWYFFLFYVYWWIVLAWDLEKPRMGNNRDTYAWKVMDCVKYCVVNLWWSIIFFFILSRSKGSEWKFWKEPPSFDHGFFLYCIKVKDI
jgi:hypothetical protein